MEQSLYELPEGWVWSSLSEQTLGTRNINPATAPDQQFSYVDISSVDRDRNEIVEPKLIRGADAPSRAKKEIVANDVLFATTRPNLKNIAVFDGDLDSPVASTGFCVLRAAETVDHRYLFRFLTTGFVQNQIAPFISGAQYPAVTDKNLKRTAIPLPPLNEQKRIVAKLDALFTCIDAAITHLQETLELSKALFASALDGAFRECEAERVSLTEVVDFIGGSQPPKSEFSEVAHDGYVRLIQIRDYKSDAHVVYVNAKSTKKFCKKDDVMIGRYGPPVFQILRGLDGAYNVALMKASPDENVLSKDYLFWFLQSPSIQGYIIGLSQRAAGQSGVNKKALEKYEIPLPPLDEQASIVEHFEVLAEHTRTLEAETQERLDQFATFKSSLLDTAFRGQL